MNKKQIVEILLSYGLDELLAMGPINRMAEEILALSQPRKIYSIWCEWDMGFEDYFPTRELAQKAIDDTDWINLVGREQHFVEDDGLVHIEEHEVTNEQTTDS